MPSHRQCVAVACYPYWTLNYLNSNLKDKIYLTGLTLIAITFLACLISFWLLVYVVFIFAIGAVFIFFSKKPIKTKLLTTILPILIYLPATYIFLLAYNYTTPKTFLIPANYQGTIRIVYEEKCGEKMHKVNGREILQFPENGILILNEKFDGGINNDYYLVDKSGRRTEIDETIDYKNSSKKLPFILVGGAGTFVSDDNKKNITYSDFYLYNKDTLQTDNYKMSQQFDSLMWKIVNDCRTLK
jgi:hypothetical protein